MLLFSLSVVAADSILINTLRALVLRDLRSFSFATTNYSFRLFWKSFCEATMSMTFAMCFLQLPQSTSNYDSSLADEGFLK